MHSFAKGQIEHANNMGTLIRQEEQKQLINTSPSSRNGRVRYSREDRQLLNWTVTNDKFNLLWCQCHFHFIL